MDKSLRRAVGVAGWCGGNATATAYGGLCTGTRGVWVQACEGEVRCTVACDRASAMAVSAGAYMRVGFIALAEVVADHSCEPNHGRCRSCVF